MRVVSFAEFAAMPEGTIYAPMVAKHGECHPDGLFRKRDHRASEGVLWAGGHDIWRLNDDSPGHREFAVYEPADLDRLATLIGRGPGYDWGRGVEVAREED